MNEARPYASLSSGLLARKGSAKPAMRPQGFGQGYGNLEDLGWNDMGHGPSEPAKPVPAEHVPSSIAALTPAPKIQRTNPGEVPFSSGDEEYEGFEGEEAYESEEACEGEPAFEGVEAVEESPSFEAAELEAAEPPAVEQAEAPVESEQPAEPVSFEAPSVVAQQRAILERFDGEEEPASAEPAPRPDVRADVVPLPQRHSADDGRKAAFTLRLDAERHLRLRLACAVSGRSAQQIVARALDEALASIPEIEALASQVPGKPNQAGKLKRS